MSTFVFLIEQLAISLYIFIGLGIFIFWRQWGRARYSFRATHFELERDYAKQRKGNAFMMMVVLLELGLIVAGIQRVVAPTVREDREVVEAFDTAPIFNQDEPLRTLTPRPPSGDPPVDASGFDLGSQQEAQIFVTPTLTPTPVGTIEPAPEPIGCNPENAYLQIPANGMLVFQPIRVAGTAFVDNFATYKIELSGPGTLNQFVVLDEGTIPIQDIGTLSQFNPAPYEPGTYQFQLMVFDTTITLKASCRITIYITEPIPTATPLGG